MPITDFDVAYLNERMRGEVYDQIIRESVLLRYMRKWERIKFKSGGVEGVDMYVRFQQSARGAKAITPFTVLEGKTINDTKKLTVPWAVYSDAISTSEILEARARNAKDADTNFNWIINQTNSFLQAFQETLAGDLYTGDGTPNTSRGDFADTVLGLSEWVDDNNTILGEDRSAAGSYFAAIVKACTDPTGDTQLSGEPNMFVDMRDAWDDASVGSQTGKDVNKTTATGRSEPDATICDKASKQLYENLLGSRMRIMAQGADASYETITFQHKPLDWDPFCPSGKMFMLKKDTWMVHTVEDDEQLVRAYAEDKSTVVKSIQYVSQILLKCKRPSNNARVDVTLPS